MVEGSIPSVGAFFFCFCCLFLLFFCLFDLDLDFVFDFFEVGYGLISFLCIEVIVISQLESRSFRSVVWPVRAKRASSKAPIDPALFSAPLSWIEGTTNKSTSSELG